MLYAAEMQQVLERYSREIDDLRTIARMHGLPTGAPEHLLVLPLRLSQDARLRSDISELVRSLQTQDPELGLPDALSIVLAAVAGSASLDRRRDLAEAVDLTGGYLASLGGWPGSAVEPTIDLDHPPDHDPRLDLNTSADTEPPVGTRAPHTATQEEVTVSASADDGNDEIPNDSTGAVTLAEITHALARLERGNLELRLHLDSIDQRICRMEPLLEAAPPPEPASPPPEPLPRGPLSASPLSDARDLVHRGSTLGDLDSQRDRLEEIKALRRISLQSNFLEPAVPSAKPPVPAAIPLPHSAEISVAAGRPAATSEPGTSARAPQPRRDRFAAAREIPGNAAETDPLYTGLEQEPSTDRVHEVAVVPDPHEALPSVIAAPEQPTSPSAPVAENNVPEGRSETPPTSGSRAWLFNDPPATPKLHTAPGPWKVTPPSIAMMDDAPPERSRTARWIAGAVAATVLGAAGFLYVNGLPSTINEWVSGSRTADSSNSGTGSSGTPGDAQIAGIAEPEATPGNAARSIPPQRTTLSPNTLARVPEARENSTSNTNIDKTNGPTFVPAGVMDGYLIAAPRPIYPEMAKLIGSQGKVTFEAMVSKAGQVEAVKVLGGPQVLRSAATDAVKQWQYRPFEVKGRPVEVRTIIRVDVGAHTGSAATE